MAGQGDILVPMTDPPLLSIVGMHAARRRGAHLVNWLQDIYPEVAIELGVPLIKGPVSTVLSYLRDASLKAADANVVVGERMAEKVRTLGVASDRIHVIPNWCDDKQITPVAAGDNPLRRNGNSKISLWSDIPATSAGPMSLIPFLRQQSGLRIIHALSFYLSVVGTAPMNSLAVSKRLALAMYFGFCPTRTMTS